MAFGLGSFHLVKSIDFLREPNGSSVKKMNWQDLSDFMDSSVEAEMKKLVLALQPPPDSPGDTYIDSARWITWEMEALLHKVHKLDLFRELIAFWVDANQKPLFMTDGKPTPAGRTFFGALFKRFDRRIFNDGASRSFRFMRARSTSQRRFVIVKLPAPSENENP